MELSCRVLGKLASWALSENPKMRWHAVRHPECPGELALLLVDDPDPQVRLGAACRLVLRGVISRGLVKRVVGNDVQFDALLGLFRDSKSRIWGKG